MKGKDIIDSSWLESQFSDLSAIKPLQKGGQKSVFSARHASNGDVVLKLVHPAADIEQAVRELSAVAEVASTRVPRILKHGFLTVPTGQIFWLLEQRILGNSLRSKISKGPLSFQCLLRLSLHVGEALVASEKVQIVHRDIKPANILEDESGNFWLIDFGIARQLQLVSLTDSNRLFGKMTWGYAPIEQCMNQKTQIDPRADLFALGVTLYECASGYNPFLEGSRDHLAVIKRLEATVKLRPSEELGLSDEFCDLVATMTQQKRIHRPRSAKEAYAWIQEICQNEGVE